jgi:hypothetical protein
MALLHRRSERLQGLVRRLFVRFGRARPGSPGWKYCWAIGIYEGGSPFDLGPAQGVANPVLTREDISDLQAEFVADPFMIEAEGRWCMFFEVANTRLSRGQIGLATSPDALRWTYQGVILAEPFHLSYPYVFRHENEYYMIPETQAQGSIELYRATKFPEAWTRVRTLLTGRPFNDPSLFHYADTWWLLTETAPGFGHHTLRLYQADALTGPWHEHPKSPVVQQNPHIARPAGRVLVLEDSVVRFAQDCAPLYGLNVQAFEITELTRRTYAERPRGAPILTGGGSGWNAAGMHHVDAHVRSDGTWIACVDGWHRAPMSS